MLDALSTAKSGLAPQESRDGRWGGTPHLISATELVQIAAPARSTGFSTFSGSLGSAKTFRGQPARPAKGASKSRTSGPQPNFSGTAFQRTNPWHSDTRWRRASESKEDPQAYASRYPGHQTRARPGGKAVLYEGRAQTWSAVYRLPTSLETLKFIGGSSAIVDVGRFSKVDYGRDNGGVPSTMGGVGFFFLAG